MKIIFPKITKIRFKPIKLNKQKIVIKSGKNPKYYQLKSIYIIIILSFIGLYVILGLISQKIIYRNISNTKLNKAILSAYPFPVAKIDGTSITVKSLLKQVSYVSQFSKQTGQEVGSDKEILNNTLDQLIETNLIKNELQKQKIEIPQKEIDANFQKVIDENGGQEDVKKVLNSLYLMTLDDFKELIKDQLARDFLNQKVLKQVHVRHILLADEKQAKELTKAIVERNDPKFEDSARIFSKDIDTRDSGGDLDFISIGSMPENFEDIVFNKAKIGETYPEPIKTEFGWHIIKVEEIRGTVNKSYEKWLEEAKKQVLIKKFI